MRYGCLPVLIISVSCFLQAGIDSSNPACLVHVNMADGSSLPAHSPMQVFGSTGKLLEKDVPADGTVTFSRLAAGEYRIQVGSAAQRFLITGPLQVSDGQACALTLSIAGRSDATNKLAEDDVDVEDLRVSGKARSLFERGFAEFERGELDKAKEKFIAVTRLAPSLSRAYNILGVIEYQQNHKSDARRYFEMALALNPVSKPALLNLAKLSATEGQYSAAIDLLERYRSGLPESADVHAMEADLYFKMGRFSEAIRQAQTTNALSHGNWAVVHLIAGKAYEVTRA